MNTLHRLQPPAGKPLTGADCSDLQLAVRCKAVSMTKGQLWGLCAVQLGCTKERGRSHRNRPHHRMEGMLHRLQPPAGKPLTGADCSDLQLAVRCKAVSMTKGQLWGLCAVQLGCTKERGRSHRNRPHHRMEGMLHRLQPPAGKPLTGAASPGGQRSDRGRRATARGVGAANQRQSDTVA